MSRCEEKSHLVSFASAPFSRLSRRRGLSLAPKVLLLLFLAELFVLTQLLLFLLAQVIVLVLTQIFLLSVLPLILAPFIILLLNIRVLFVLPANGTSRDIQVVRNMFIPPDRLRILSLWWVNAVYAAHLTFTS